MDIESFRDYCLSFKGATEDLPFNDSTLVFKVRGKIFALTDINKFKSFNVKCDPVLAIELRETYETVGPGYHMNKKYWNTVQIDGQIPDEILKKWILHSYELVVEGLSRKQRIGL